MNINIDFFSQFNHESYTQYRQSDNRTIYYVVTEYWKYCLSFYWHSLCVPLYMYIDYIESEYRHSTLPSDRADAGPKLKLMVFLLRISFQKWFLTNRKVFERFMMNAFICAKNGNCSFPLNLTNNNPNPQFQ